MCIIDLKPSAATIILAAVLISCAAPDKITQRVTVLNASDSTLHVKSDSFEGVLFTRNFVVGCFSDARCVTVLEYALELEPAQFWTADLSDILSVEAALERHFEQTKSKTRRYEDGDIPYTRIDVPLRQYIGMVDTSGVKQLWVNMLPPGSDKMPRPNSHRRSDVPRWLVEPILVEDGGPYFFRFRFNLETRVLHHWEYNAHG